MSKISFYDLDYIISLNEKRLEQYSDAYQKNIGKLTNLLIIYSAFAVFIVPVTYSLFFSGLRFWLNYGSYIIFVLFLGYSLIYTIKLLIPVEVAYLIEPKDYYVKYRLEYEAEGKNQEKTDNLVKASYINELEKAVAVNNSLFKRKGFFYYRALISGLIACIPYVICLVFHFTNKIDNVQKVEIINSDKFSTFNLNSNMSKGAKNTNSTTASSSNNNTISQLPGIKISEVKPSNPQMIRENFHEQSKNKK